MCDIGADETAALLSFAEDVAREAGKIVRRGFSAPQRAYTRKSATDPVTEVDLASERYIRARVRDAYPAHAFVGEEGGGDEDVLWSDEGRFCWCADPLDGTSNYVHLIPFVAVSIGLTYRKTIVVGVIYNPILDEMFCASHLTPSTLNGACIRVSAVSSMQSACVATEAGSNRSPEKTALILEGLRSVLANDAQAVRAIGSCALNMAFVAMGRYDLLYEAGPYSWDMCAGALIIQQAGGIILSAGGREFDLKGRTLVACTPGLHAEVGELLGALGTAASSERIN